VKNSIPSLFALLVAASFLAAEARAEIRIPAFTAYLDPDSGGATVEKEGISGWTNPKVTVSWFGEIKTLGDVTATVALRLPKDKVTRLRLFVGEQPHKMSARGTGEAQTIGFGEYSIAKAGYTRFRLESLNAAGGAAGDIDALILDGPAADGAHFNLDPRRNAASVHSMYATPKEAQVELFYNEIVGVADPVATYYMACGFSRGYFGMQVNSPTERRIIFSVWDSGAGQTAKERNAVSDENRVKLLAKGERVVASDFGNEGAGGHSHLIYSWKTGQPQRFVVTGKAEDDHTDYSGWWFDPDQRKWTLIASFRAPRDGKWLRGLYSFSENFGGANGHLQRKALFGPQWIRTTEGKWQEITEASFSHDGTGKENRLDRFMGVEQGRFFLSNGGFVPGFTPFGGKFTRPPASQPPTLPLGEMSVK
jgi:hypothetical protein